MKIIINWKNPWLRAVLLGIAMSLLIVFAGDHFRFLYQAY